MDEKVLHITRSLFESPAVDIPPPRQEFNIKRSGARVHTRAGVPVRLHFWDVTLLDISSSGALLEHDQRVRVGEVYRLSFEVEGLHVGLTGRTVRSFVSHRIPVAGGEQQIMYRTGLEFTGLTEDTAQLISAYVTRVRRSELAR